MGRNFTCLMIFLCGLIASSSHASMDFEHLSYLSRRDPKLIHVLKVKDNNYGEILPFFKQTTIVYGSVSRINTLFYSMRASTSGKDPGLHYPLPQVFSFEEEGAYYIVIKITRPPHRSPASLSVTRVEGVDVPERRAAEGFFKIDNSSDFKRFQRKNLKSLSDPMQRYPAWVEEEIETQGAIDGSYWLIDRVNAYESQRFVFRNESSFVVDKKSGDIYLHLKQTDVTRVFKSLMFEVIEEESEDSET